MVFRNKMYLRSFIFYFVPFTIIAATAVAFLHKTYSLKESQNISIMQLQIQNILDSTEEWLFRSSQIADDIWVDSSLNQKNMNEHGLHTLTGMENVGRYEERMGLETILFLLYHDDYISGGRCGEWSFHLSCPAYVIIS